MAPDATAGQLAVAIKGVPLSVTVNGRRRWGRKDDGGTGGGPQQLIAPMPGKIVRISVAAGDEVKAGQGVIVMEAMKMQNEMKSPKDGRVQKITTTEGATVNPGDVLAVIE